MTTFVRPRPAYVIPAALAYSVFSIPHFVFHLEHLHGASTGQAVFLTTANAAVALLGLAAVALAALGRRPATGSPGSAGTPAVPSGTRPA